MSEGFDERELFLAAVDLSPSQAISLINRALVQSESVRRNVLELLRMWWLKSGSLTLVPGAESLPPFTGNSRFELLETLGSGGFGDVYRARDKKYDVTVALKVLRSHNPEVISGFKNEFRALKRVVHPNIANIHEIIFDEPSGRWLLTMDHIKGVTLGEFFRAISLTIGKLKDVFRQIVRVVAEIHLYGILHCDLTPRNIMVTAADGQAMLLDFGLARRKEDADAPIVGGTKEYLAPELLNNCSPDESCDWYSLGIILRDALRKVADCSAPDLAILQAIVARMTAHDRHLRPSAAEVLHAFDSKVREPVTSVLFGRDKQWTQMLSGYYRAVEGECVAIFVGGPSGIGKTHLVDCFLQWLVSSSPEALIFRAKCYHTESIPWKTLDEITERLASWLQSLSQPIRELVYPHRSQALERLFPAFRRVETPVAQHQEGLTDNPSKTRVDALSDLHALFSGIRLHGLLPVVFVDDLQWGDADSLALLAAFVSARNASRMLLIVGLRSESVEPDSVKLFKEQTAATNPIFIAVDALGEAEARRYVLHLLSSSTASLQTAGRIVTSAAGNPFLVRLLAESDRQEFSSEDGTGTMLQVLASRVTAMPQHVRHVAELLALAGGPLTVDAAKQAAGEIDLLRATDWLQSRNWIRFHGGPGEQFDFYHDALRDSVLSLIPDEFCLRHHRSLARAFEASGAEPETAAAHFAAAGLGAEAIRHLHRAVQRAHAALAFDQEVRLLKRLLNLTPADSPDRFSLLYECATALVNAGRGSEAADFFIAASSLCPPKDQIPLRARAAGEWLRSGEIRKGKDQLRQIAETVGLPFPESSAETIRHLIFERFRLFLGRYDPGTWRLSSQNLAIRLDTAWAALGGLQRVDPPLALLFSTVYLRLSLCNRNPKHLAVAMATEALRHAYTDDGRCRKTWRMLDLAESHARDSGDRRVDAHVQTCRGLAALLTGRWDQSHDHGCRALVLFQEGPEGAAWEMTSARAVYLSARVFTGNWKENLVEIPDLVEDARRRRDLDAVTNLHLLASSYTAELQTDQPLLAIRRIDDLLAQWPSEKFDIQQLQGLIGKASLNLYAGEPADAWRLIELGWPAVRGSHLLRLTLLAWWAHYVRSAAAIALVAVTGGNARRDQLLGIASFELRCLKRMKATYVPGFCALLEAGILSVQGDFAGARTMLARARKDLYASRLVPWWAVASLRLAGLSRGQEAVELQLDGASWMREQTIKRPERLMRMLSPGDWGKIV